MLRTILNTISQFSGILDFDQREHPLSTEVLWGVYFAIIWLYVVPYLPKAAEVDVSCTCYDFYFSFKSGCCAGLTLESNSAFSSNDQ